MRKERSAKGVVYFLCGLFLASPLISWAVGQVRPVDLSTATTNVWEFKGSSVKLGTTNSPAASATSALVQVGAAPVGANSNGQMAWTNAPSGFTGYLAGGQVNGGTPLWAMDYTGEMGVGGTPDTTGTNPPRIDVVAGSIRSAIRFRGTTLTAHPDFSSAAIFTNPSITNDTFASYGIQSSSLGGGLAQALTSASVTGATNVWVLRGIYGITTPTTGAAVALQGYKWDGVSNVAALASTERIINIFNAGSVIDYITGDGSINPTGQNAVNIAMSRHTTSNTAGNNLTVQAGGATSAATDKAGGSLILSPGPSTGTGRATVNIKGNSVATSTGTSDNTQVDRAIYGATKALTNNSAISIVNATDASNTVTAGVIHYAVEVFDGTNLQVENGAAYYHCINKSGVFSGNAITKSGNIQDVTSGTLTVTFAISAANPAVISVNANSSLTPSTGYPRITYSIDNLTPQAIAVL